MNDNNLLPEDKDLLLNHEYDGIKELNHPLPNWWLMTFYVAIVFSGIYVVFLHIFDGPTIQKEYREDLAMVQARVDASGLAQKDGLNGILAEIEKAAKDPTVLELGKQTYQSKCAACHGPDGGGSVGPNLTDAFWVNGNGSTASLYKVIDSGVAEKGMPPWGPVLKIEEMKSVVAYVGSLKGTSPSQPKAPQGNQVPAGN